MKLVFLSLILFFEINCFSQTITGKVLDTDTKNPLFQAAVYLVNPEITEDTVNICYWDIYKYKVIAETKTDAFGQYSFASILPGLYSIVVRYKMPEIKELNFGYSFREDIDSNITVNCTDVRAKISHLLVTCPYDKTKNQSFCPNCKKIDKVVPIFYGLPMFDENGIINGLKEGQYTLGGCIRDLYCNPTKTCLRCKLAF